MTLWRHIFASFIGLAKRYALLEATHKVRLNYKKSFSFKGLEEAPQGAEKEWKIMYAVIKTGGKQYRVAANDKILIEKLEGEAGDHISFTNVLMVTAEGQVHVGAPFLEGATVVGEIEKQARGPHLIIFKKRRRKHYRRRNGHRQDLTSIIITEILTGGAKPTGKRAEVKAKAEAAPVVEAAATSEAAPVAAPKASKPRAKAAKPAADKE